MSDEEQNIGDSSDGEMLTAEFKDGKLEIVEVASYSKGNTVEEEEMSSDVPELKYVQVVDSKDTVVDLLNFTLVRSEDGGDYRLVSSDGAGDHSSTVTCVLTSDDGDESGSQQYVMVEGVSAVAGADGAAGAAGGPAARAQRDGSLLLLPRATTRPRAERKAAFKTPSSPTEILEKTKALQKAKILMRCTEPRTSTTELRPARGSEGRGRGRGGRRGRSELPPPHELLATPGFKLFLYSCKLCRFKCNAIKELTAHKALEHAGGGGAGGARWRGARAPPAGMQCARCPYRAATHSQLMKHVQENHVETISTEVYLESAEVEAADVLVCGACGFECTARERFRRHVRERHPAAAC